MLPSRGNDTATDSRGEKDAVGLAVVLGMAPRESVEVQVGDEVQLAVCVVPGLRDCVAVMLGVLIREPVCVPVCVRLGVASCVELGVAICVELDEPVGGLVCV